MSKEKSYSSTYIKQTLTNVFSSNIQKEIVSRNGKNANGSVKKTLKKPDAYRLLSLAKPETVHLIAAVGLLIVSSAVTMSVPFCIGKIIDIIYTASKDPEQTMKLLSNICKILFGVFLVGGMANFGRVYLVQMAGQRIVKRLRHKLFSSIMLQETAFFDLNKTGELINRLSADTVLVGKAVTDNVSDGLRATAQAIAGVSMMVYVSPKLAGLVLVIVPTVAVGTVIYGRFLKSITRKVQDSLADATQVAEERISNIRIVRAFGQENKEIQRYGEKIEHVLSLSMKETLARAVFFGFTGFSGNCVVLTVLYAGGLMMTDAQISVGDLTSFLLYTGFVGISVGGLSSFYSELMKGIGASERLWQLMDRKPAIAITGGYVPPINALEKGIQFQNIHFSYPSRPDVPIFKDLTLDVPAGSVTALVGPSGSGKSTLGSLLLRLYDPDQGHVIVGGHDVKTLSLDWLRGSAGTVHQDPILFSCSIGENIAYGAAADKKVTADDIIDAAKQANAHSFIQSFTKGYDTVVGERGQMLSGGQRQRIAIARAILMNPKILLLDEATSALDAESEHLVQEALERLMKGRTVITIAHRLSTIKNADHIVVLDNGAIAESGSYNQLMAHDNGLFKKLVERQTIANSNK
ncbi:ATP-binding cassette sub-family B member 10, mitochondrial-like isoform X2 [Actinia tenebrosa]|uniref:ATP-binding cassette sub-family B member 10, mitochondrial n=1 Tax=Actinia tenebrosa TaxID=6105 RepID=A0A6P8IK45_ACTTE|nr:ATP-binding cassette sub-family B member 10, mitochondrial-like isoform X2 [Actinia tenebrosa]